MHIRERPQSMKSFLLHIKAHHKATTVEEALKNKVCKMTQPVAQASLDSQLPQNWYDGHINGGHA